MTRFVDELVQTLRRPRLARCPVFIHLRCPIGLGREQLPVGKRVARGPMFRRSNFLRRRQRLGRWHMLRQSPHKRRVNLERRARAGFDGVRRQQVIAVMTNQFATLGQPLRHRLLCIAPPGFIMADAMDGGCADFLGKRAQYLVRPASPQYQPRTNFP